MQQSAASDNPQALDKYGIQVKFNNDVLIPRSILKRNEINRRELYDREVVDDLKEFDEIIGQGTELEIDPNEGIVGRHLDLNGPILSPKTFNQNYLQNHYKKME